MDGSPKPPTPPAPPTAGTPYREGKPLAEIIPPDRRALKTAALVLTSMVAGVALWTLGGSLRDMIRALDEPETRPVVTPGYVAGRIPPSLLHGPGGSIALPPHTRTVVHVWLQGCADCMPAFEAMYRLQTEGRASFDAPVINVAYGEADLTWAQRYGVAENLVFDPGGLAVVRPLGIGSFTSLVVEPSGAIIHSDRPDRPGYMDRMRNAVLFGDPRDRRTPPPAPTGFVRE